jgi:photosystem II stability/assembly factor-like uncharacterized protein
MKQYKCIWTVILLCSSFFLLQAQDEEIDIYQGLEFRSIGPAFMSGRIADMVIDHTDESYWYVAVGSGGVWKTTNSGVTWESIFDGQGSYSIGCITMDPNDRNRLWVGTGENVGGRHVGYGDGVYLSIDAGKTWSNMGLNKTEHISKIIVHPNDPNTIWIASQGPLWSKGGERGVYKSTDGGENWKRTLGDDQWTGATDLLINPDNPDVLYAATWDRHRTVAAYLGGGPGTAIHKSIDGGNNWTKLSNGLPSSHLGKIGLAMSYQNPDIIYAAIEEDLRSGGVYQSIDAGSNWIKKSDAVAGATGPHYYQELYTSPHQEGRLYLVDNRMQISDDHGKTFRRMNEKNKHGDNHAVAFKMSDPDYLLVGSDGGVYESFDLAKTWRYIPNLPITQFYKIAVDDAKPFYNVYGGTQDNSTECGPSRTDNYHGIQNSDWKVVLNWDGHQPATEPGNPNIVYAQRQQGTLSRLDMKTGEVIDIQPQAGEGEVHERFNWDAPILVSPHDPKRIFFASYRLWESNDRGDNWRTLSDDLTRNENRMEMPIMGRQQSYDNAWDLFAMSNYNTITSIAESPVQRDLIYIGTDDGLIQVTEDGGVNWRTIDFKTVGGIPDRAYVNDIKADLFDENVAYAIMDNHKEGDYKAYVYKTSDKGITWRSISNNLPNRNLVWRLVQDHVNPKLMFLGTEFGIYFTIDGGMKWTQLKSGLPTISFRDLQIQRRENDLVCGSFGRSIYILDDYSPLRSVDSTVLNKEAHLFPVKDSWWYIPRSALSFGPGKGSQGDDHFLAENPPFGATFSYYLKEDLQTSKEKRQERESNMGELSNIPFPGFDQLDKEASENEPSIWFTVKDQNGLIVNKIKGPSKAGIHRVNWALDQPIDRVVTSTGNSEGMNLLASPGRYTVSMSKYDGKSYTEVSEAQNFEVKAMRTPSLQGSSLDELAAFWSAFNNLVKKESYQSNTLESLESKVKLVKAAADRSSLPLSSDVFSRIESIRGSLIELNKARNGSASQAKPGEKTKPTIGERLFAIQLGISNSTYGPTAFHNKNIEIINRQLNRDEGILQELNEGLRGIANIIRENGGPMIMGF